MSGTWDNSSPELFRMPVTITGEMHPVPDPPDGPKLFGLADNITKVMIAHAHSAKDGQQVGMRDQCTMGLNLTAMSDGVGTVLSVGITLKDKHGKVLECISLMIAQEDVERIASAASALFPLTPKPGETA